MRRRQIFLAAVGATALAGCGTVGDGKFAGGDAQTEFGKRLVSRTAAVRVYLDEHPQIRVAIRLARGAACVAKPGLPLVCSSDEVVAKVRQVRAFVDDARAAGSVVDASDAAIADELRSLGDDWLAIANNQVEDEQ